MYILDAIFASKQKYLQYQKEYYSMLSYQIQYNRLKLRDVSSDDIIDFEWFNSNPFSDLPLIYNHISHIRSFYVDTCYDFLKIYYLILGEDIKYLFNTNVYLKNTANIQQFSLEIKYLILSNIVYTNKTIKDKAFIKVNKKMNSIYNNI